MFFSKATPNNEARLCKTDESTLRQFEALGRGRKDGVHEGNAKFISQTLFISSMFPIKREESDLQQLFLQRL